MGLGACLLFIDIADVLCMVHVVPNFTKEGHFLKKSTSSEEY
jgi:hypothetical protein